LGGKDLSAIKKALREEVINKRMALSSIVVKEKSASIKDKICKMDIFKKVNNVMLFVDFRNEVQTGEIIIQALKEGKRVFAPITDVKNRDLYPTEISKYPEDLVEGAWGIMEPRKGNIIEPDKIDLVIVPGVAFDQMGNRLGYGGGFYDRFLPRVKDDTLFVAIAYELQIVNNVYFEEHDQPVHYIVTEDRIIKAI